MRNLSALNPLFSHTASSQPWKARIVESESPVVMENGTAYSTWACRVSPKVFQRLQRLKLVHEWLVWKVRSSRCYSRDGVLTVLWWWSCLVWLVSRHSIPPCALVFNWKLLHLYKRTLSYATLYACVAVPGRNRTLFRPCALVFNWKLSHLYKRTLSYATTYACYYWFSLPGVRVEVGGEVVCCMLDVNWSESCIIVSLNPKLTEGHDATEQKVKSSKRGKRRKPTLVTMG